MVALYISRDGAVSGLQTKGGGFDLRGMGMAVIGRVSDILWDVDSQAWEIHMLRGTRSGVLTVERLREVGMIHETPCKIPRWREYEDAVTAEVEYVNACILRGCGEFVGLVP